MLSEDKIVDQAERSVIQRAIWSLPKPVLWILVAVILVGTYFYGGK